MNLIPTPDELPPPGDPIGPNCAFDAFITKSPTGYTWRELEERRNAIFTQNYTLKGITVITDEMLCTIEIPEYKSYKSIKNKKNDRT